MELVNPRPLLSLDDAGVGRWQGLSVRDRPLDECDVVVVGVPFDGGVGGRNGAARAPGHVRSLGARLKTISRRGVGFGDLRLRDLGDVAVRRLDLPATIAEIERAYGEVMAACSAPILSFGGDHSVTYPIVKALARERRTGLIWLDAHPDVLDHYHGSPLTHGSPLRRILDDGGVDPAHVLVAGTRAYDDGEPEYLQERGVRELPAVELEEPDAVSRFAAAAREIAERVDQIYVTIDIDVLDVTVAPGTGTPVAGGLTSAALLRLIEVLPGRLRGVDLVELAPVYDPQGITDAATLAILTEVLARLARDRPTRPR
ncbi:MAG TPA: arginase family protein [Kofleriaceae bacterium]